MLEGDDGWDEIRERGLGLGSNPLVYLAGGVVSLFKPNIPNVSFLAAVFRGLNELLVVRLTGGSFLE